MNVIREWSIAFIISEMGLFGGPQRSSKIWPLEWVVEVKWRRESLGIERPWISYDLRCGCRSLHGDFLVGFFYLTVSKIMKGHAYICK